MRERARPRTDRSNRRPGTRGLSLHHEISCKRSTSRKCASRVATGRAWVSAVAAIQRSLSGIGSAFDLKLLPQLAIPARDPEVDHEHLSGCRKLVDVRQVLFDALRVARA